MNVYAIGDLHFSLSEPKPMDIFGGNWDKHCERVMDNWSSAVKDEDIVLIPGDISWAMTLESAMMDLNAIGRLPGKKVIMRGNHDYWWSSVSKVRALLPDGIYALQNDSVRIDGLCVCGTRGWTIPSETSDASDVKIYNREVGRMELSLKARDPNSTIIGMTHFPPFDEKQSPSGFTALYEQYGVKRAIYGHLHGRSCAFAFEGRLGGVEYELVSSDHLNFMPKLIFSI